MAISQTDKVILIGGGSSSGKSSIAHQMKKIRSPLKLFHLDFDDQVSKLMQAKYDNDTLKAIEHVIRCLPEAASGSSFFLDHWMPPKLELQARQALSNSKVFTVWVYCSSITELKRREATRKQRDDYRGDGVTAAGARSPANIGYDYTVDSFQKTPKRLATLIHKKAMRNWGY